MCKVKDSNKKLIAELEQQFPMVCIIYGLISKQGFESISSDSIKKKQDGSTPKRQQPTVVMDQEEVYRNNLKNMIDLCSSESDEESVYVKPNKHGNKKIVNANIINNMKSEIIQKRH